LRLTDGFLFGPSSAGRGPSGPLGFPRISSGARSRFLCSARLRRAKSSLMRPKGRVAAGARSRLRPCGPRDFPYNPAFWHSNGAQRRKAERPPELMRGKPSSADALRPAPEGANKQPEDCARGGERLSKKRAKVTGMRFDSAAVPATVSGECEMRAPSHGQPLGAFGPPGRRATHALIREPGDRPGRVALCLVQGLARRGNTFVVSDIAGLWGKLPRGHYVADDGRKP
jgi:hypothetical protein